MTTRANKKGVTFAFPFQLDGDEEMFAAGNYTVETEEESLEGPSFLAYRCIATTLIRHSPRGTFRRSKYWTIDPDELILALERDAQKAHTVKFLMTPKSETAYD